MRITAIIEENRVNVEGFSHTVDCSALMPDIHVIQWYGDHGEIEYHNGIGATTLRMPTKIDDFSPFQFLVDAWEVEAKKDAA